MVSGNCKDGSVGGVNGCAMGGNIEFQCGYGETGGVDGGVCWNGGDTTWCANGATALVSPSACESGTIA